MYYTVDALSLWENTWLMSFNSSKCYILCMNRSKVKPTVNYFLDGQPLSLVDSHDTYLGITISSDWHWQNRTSSICAMASRIVNFVRRNIYGCSAEAKATAYTTLVRPLLEFSSAAWDLSFSQGRTPTWMCSTGPKIVFPDTKCAVDFVKCAVDFAGVCYVK